MEETPQIGNSGGATSSSIMETPQTETYEGQRILEETLAAEDGEIRIRDDRREERLRAEQNQVQPRQLEQQTPALNQTLRSPGPGQQKKIEIAFTQPCCRLDEKDITPKLVQEFRHQARHNPTLVTADVVTGDARDIIKFHLLGDNSQPWMLPANRTSWWEHVNIEQAAEIVARYFQQQQHESAIPIAHQSDAQTGVVDGLHHSQNGGLGGDHEIIEICAWRRTHDGFPLDRRVAGGIAANSSMAARMRWAAWPSP